MTKERIDKAIEVLKLAIREGISAKKASEKMGYSSTYVKNVKAVINTLYEEQDISDGLYDYFYETYNKYESLRKIAKNDNAKTNFVQVLDERNSKNSTNAIVTSIGGDFRYVEDGDVAEATWDFHKGYPEGHVKTLDELIDKSKIDLSKWDIVRHVINKWDVTSFKSGEPVTWENFQVKATLERNKVEEKKIEFKEILENFIKEFEPSNNNKFKSIPKRVDEETNLLEISLFDLHIGKLGWAGEVGENYDTTIAYNRFMDAVDNLIKRSSGFKISKILFPIGNDFFNSDNLHNTTTAGTPQDEDLRWQKTFKLGCKLIVDAIEKLKTLNVPVDVMIIPGNHDFERSYYLGTVMEAWFKNDEQVDINNGANPRKYYRFGDNLLGFTHGNEEKETSLPMLMATEQPDLWGKTKFREWHLGHFHKKRTVKYAVFDKAQTVNEEGGVIVRYLSSLSGTEEWHFKKGYVTSHKAGEAYIWNDKSGMIANLNFNFTDFNREQ